MLFIVQPACRVADNHVRSPCLRRRDRVKDDGGGITALTLLDDLTAAALRPDIKLLDGGGTEGVGCRKKNLLAVPAERIGKLADGGGLSHTVDADHQNDGRTGGNIQFLSALKHLGDDFLEQAVDLLRVGDAALSDAVPQLTADLVRGGHTDIAHDEQLLELLKQLLVNCLERIEHGVDLTHDRLSGLF